MSKNSRSRVFLFRLWQLFSTSSYKLHVFPVNTDGNTDETNQHHDQRNDDKNQISFQLMLTILLIGRQDCIHSTLGIKRCGRKENHRLLRRTWQRSLMGRRGHPLRGGRLLSIPYRYRDRLGA